MDVPIIFDERMAGESKLTLKLQVLYIQQLLALYWDRYAALIVMLFVAVLAMLYKLFQLL